MRKQEQELLLNALMKEDRSGRTLPQGKVYL